MSAHDDLDFGDASPVFFPAGFDRFFDRAKAKRFTDAELAADYHAMDSLCRREQWIEAVRGDDYTAGELQGQTGMYDRLNIIYRFATTPSYDK